MAIQAAISDVDAAMLLSAETYNLTDGSTLVLAFLAGYCSCQESVDLQGNAYEVGLYTLM